MASIVTSKTGVFKMDVGVNANGTIAQSGETVTGKKAISIPGLLSDCTLAQVNAVFNEIVTKIGGGSYDTISGEQTLKRKVVE